MGLALVIQFGAPIVLAILLYKKEKVSVASFLIGVLCFTVTQLFIRIPLLQLLQLTDWYKNLVHSSIFLATLLLAFSAGVFEEVGRFLSFRYILKNELEWKNGVAFGIGHGGIESIFLGGFANVNNIAVSLIINSGAFDNMAKQLPAETADMIKEQLTSIAPATFLAGGLERVFTLFIHIGLSLLVLYGVRNKKYIYLLFSILIHTLINLVLPLISQFLGIWGTEALIALIAIIFLVLTLKARRWFEPSAYSS
jgi:uncharacterized membrane protein YhfC